MKAARSRRAISGGKDYWVAPGPERPFERGAAPPRRGPAGGGGGARAGAARRPPPARRYPGREAPPPPPPREPSARRARSTGSNRPLESSPTGAREIDDPPLFREPIPTLPPGKKIRVLFDQFNDRLDAGLPLTYDVELRYRGPVGRNKWSDLYRLDLGIYLGSQLPPKGIPELVTEVENVRKEIERWRDSGIRVHASDQRRQDRIATRRTNARIFRQQGHRALARWLWDRALRRYG